MRSKLFYAVLIGILLSGCLITGKTKDDKKKNIETYKVDLDADGAPELIEIEDRFVESNDSIVRITKLSNNRNVAPKEYNLVLPGHFIRAEIIDLDTDNFRQLAFYYESKANRVNIVIYKLKNDKVSKIFSISSNCDIETNLDLVPRVRVAKSKVGGKDCSASLQGNDWESWAWNGEKFIKEH